jgi:1,4-dihydroxy-2-naphthoate octaprenyltransferase
MIKLLVLFLAVLTLVSGLGFTGINIANDAVKITADNVKMHSCMCVCYCRTFFGMPVAIPKTPLSEIFVNAAAGLFILASTLYVAKKSVKLSSPTYRM